MVGDQGILVMPTDHMMARVLACPHTLSERAVTWNIVYVGHFALFHESLLPTDAGTKDVD